MQINQSHALTGGFDLKSLVSNGLLSVGEWMGVDTELQYPGVETCITVTCLAGSKLVGCHLFHYWQPGSNEEHHNQCLTTFANAAKQQGLVKAIYIVGNVEHWGDRLPGVIMQLRTKLGYRGPIGGSEPASCSGDIAVKLKGPVALAFTNGGNPVELDILAV